MGACTTKKIGNCCAWEACFGLSSDVWHVYRGRESPPSSVSPKISGNSSPREGTLIHGDFRLDNCLVTPEGEVAAVLDWEISTLGDPLADLGILLAYWSEPTDDFLPLGDAATTDRGFLSRSELVATYQKQTGRDTSDMEFFFAFASWRLACILEGVHARYVGGANPEIPDEVEVFPHSVIYLAERAATTLGV